MKPFINSPEDVARFRAVAESWIGTRYVPDGAVKGTGCSCSMAPYAIMSETGFDVPRPPARGEMLKPDILPLMLKWLTDHEGTHFLKIENHADVRCGDVILFDAGIGHLALSIGGQTIVHSWQRGGVHYTQIGGDAYSKVLIGIWRPIVQD